MLLLTELYTPEVGRIFFKSLAFVDCALRIPVGSGLSSLVIIPCTPRLSFSGLVGLTKNPSVIQYQNYCPVEQRMVWLKKSRQNEVGYDSMTHHVVVTNSFFNECYSFFLTLLKMCHSDQKRNNRTFPGLVSLGKTVTAMAVIFYD